jgi:hypothetical protein
VQLLREYGWQIDKGCRLFSQVNHSELLAQFTEAVLRDSAKAQAVLSSAGEPESIDLSGNADLSSELN